MNFGSLSRVSDKDNLQPLEKPRMDMEPFVFSRPGALVGARCAETAEGDGMLDQINRFALRPLRLEEVAVFTMDLCNNRVDRHFSRFPDEELERVNWLTPGRPLMERHDLRGSLPRGTFFQSRLHREGDCASVRPEVYVLRSAENRDFILNIEGGVYRETSIGFSFGLPECSICGKDLRVCAHVPGKSYGDAVCHFIMRDVLEVIEGSVVSAGSQGTRFVMQRRLRKEAALTPPVEALAQAREIYHRPIELRERLWSME